MGTLTVCRLFILSGILLAAVAMSLSAATVGSGAPTPLVQQSFVNAYLRGQFPLLANPTPLGDVRTLGSPGYVQEFSMKGNTSLKLALVKPDPFAPASLSDTFQVFSDIYSIYTAVGVNTAGYPVNDTTACPPSSFGTCNYELFTKNYAMFAYSVPFVQSFTVRDPYYSIWMTSGGVSGPFGPVTSSETAVTSYSKVAGTVQSFSSGSIFVYPAGSTTPTVHTILEPMNTAFARAGGYAALGFPTNETATDSKGVTRQSFENGRIEVASDGTAAVLYPISQIDILYANAGLILSLNSTATISAVALDTRGYAVTGRTLSWSSSNGAVVSVTGIGETGSVKAVGSGTANIYVTGEGKTSLPIAVTVRGACCALGDGAPSSTGQAFQTALARNKITALPLTAPAVRTGNGYVQAFTGSDGTGYVVAQADNAQSAWVIGGGVYAVYLTNGGFGGPMGYPASDLMPGNVQGFASGAVIAGLSLPRVIPSAIAAKWLQLAPGDPVSDWAPFVSFSGKAGASQNFVNGTIFALNTGTAYLSVGPILARYLALGAATGSLGVPLSDITFNGLVSAQNFEAGMIDLQPGAAAAVEHFYPRHPALSITPTIVTPGGRVHIVAAGFAPGAALNFTITGQSGFSVQPTAGAFEWDVLIPATAKSSAVTVQAKAATSLDAASASYSIASPRELLATLTLVSGDQQSGFPGSTLAAPLVIAVRDAAGNALQGVPVSWTTSGATLRGSGVTDAAGLATLRVRLPLRAGVTVGSVSAGGQTVDFSALGVAGLLPGARNPSADVLAQYLAAHNGFYASDSGALIANPWIAAAAAGGSFAVEASDPDHIRDLLGAGTSVVLVLSSPSGTAAVSLVTGVDSTGAITLADTTLNINAYSVVAVLPVGGAGRAGAFTVESKTSAGATVSSPAGACAAVDVQGVRFHLCDGTGLSYEVDFTDPTGASVITLSSNAVQTIAPGTGLSFALGQRIVPQPIAITAVVDSAAFEKRVSPGGLFTIFGAGLATGPPAVSISGKPAKILVAFPFQINAQVPTDAVSGTLQVMDLLGSASQALTVSASSPGIFVVGNLGAILNQDATLNAPDNPALRGQFVSIYCTGLGTGVATQVLVNGSTVLPTSFAGTVAGFVGLYQVNVQLPAGLPPGNAQTVQVRTGGALSNAVPLAVQ